MENQMEIKLTFSDLSSFVGNRNRMQTEGEAVLAAGHLVRVGVKNVIGESINVVGICLQSSKIRDNPHEINIKFAGSYSSWKCKCSCKAGAGSHCKHICAVLLYIFQ